MNRTLKIALLTIIVIISIITNVFASNSCKVELKTDKKEYRPNEEFMVNVFLSNVNVEKGLIAIGGKLQYDKDTLQLVKIEGKNNWSNPSYNEQNGKFVVDRNGYGTNDEIVFQITFKVKAQINKNITITINDIEASNGKEDIKLNDISNTITVVVEKTEQKPSQNGNTNQSTTNTGSNIENSSTSNKNSNTSNQTTSVNKGNNVSQSPNSNKGNSISQSSNVNTDLSEIANTEVNSNKIVINDIEENNEIIDETNVGEDKTTNQNLIKQVYAETEMLEEKGSFYIIYIILIIFIIIIIIIIVTILIKRNINR